MDVPVAGPDGDDEELGMGAPRRWSVALVAIAAGVTLLAGVAVGPGAQAAPGQAGRVQGGVEDGTFSSSCLHGRNNKPATAVVRATTYRGRLGDGLVRILVPYNVATHRKSHAFRCLNNYLKAARGKARVEVSLSRVGSAAADPSTAHYRAAVKALARTEGKRITYLTAFNEPNNKAYLKTAHPSAKAGHFYVVANQAFPGKVVAGDFASGVSAGFLNAYIAALGKARPKIWALHPYTDVTNFQFFLSQQPAKHKNPQAAGKQAAARSKVLQLARELARHRYGTGTQIWLNEIYVDHTADKCSPSSPKGGCTGKGKVFLAQNQADAALFLSGGLGADSLPGVLKGHKLPQLTRYVYLRASAAAQDTQLPDADVLQIHFPDCLYYTLAGSKSTPAPQCS
jgi:hypothetical protein